MRLLSWMNGVKANTGQRMENTRLREPSYLQLPHSRPGQVVLLAATNQSLSPQPRHPETEYAEATGIARYRVVVEIALYDRFEPPSGLRDRFVQALTELLFDFSQLRPQALAYRMALHRKVPVPRHTYEWRYLGFGEILGKIERAPSGRRP